MNHHPFEPTQGVITSLNVNNKELTDVIDVNFDGIVGNKNSGRTRIAHSQDVQAGRADRKGEILLNDRQITIITDKEVAKIASELGVEALTVLDMNINIGVSLENTPEIYEGVPGISNLPPRSLLIFNNGLRLEAGMPILPCSGMGQKIIENHPTTDTGKALQPNDFPKASKVNIQEESVTIRGLGAFTSVLGTDIASCRLQIGDTFKLSPPPKYIQPKIK